MIACAYFLPLGLLIRVQIVCGMRTHHFILFLMQSITHSLLLRFIISLTLSCNRSLRRSYPHFLILVCNRCEATSSWLRLLHLSSTNSTLDELSVLLWWTAIVHCSWILSLRRNIAHVSKLLVSERWEIKICSNLLLLLVTLLRGKMLHYIID